MLFKVIMGYENNYANPNPDPTPLEVPRFIKFISSVECRNILSSSICIPFQENTALYASTINNVRCIVTFNQLPYAEKKYFNENVSITLDEAIDICSNTQKQKCNIWLNERKKRITASCAHNFYTYVYNKNPDWNKKISDHLNNTFQGCANTVYGQRCKNKARDCYERLTGNSVTQADLLVNPKIPWIGFSPDGLLLHLLGQKIIEIKCPVPGKEQPALEVVNSLSWILKDTNQNFYLKPTYKYYCQVQIGMFVANVRNCDLVIYSSYDDSAVIIDVPFDEQYIRDIIPNLQFVYFSYILPQLTLQKNVN